MAVDVLMPQLGETVAEGRITAWFKRPGETVVAGENLFEIETDKATVEVTAPASGVLGKILKQTGEPADVGEVIGQVE
jgi:pyruvate dehydrogenase E2 component (dihydrolipoamide acetyltransferase)